MYKKLTIFFVLIAIIAAVSFIMGYENTKGNLGYTDGVEEKGTGQSDKSTTQESRNGETQADKTPNQGSQPPKEEKDPIRKQINDMTMDEKIGQMVLVGFDGYEVNDDVRQLIEKYHTGGFILYKTNIKDSTQMLSLLNALKSANSANNIPLFLSVDEEGGRISRMPDALAKIPTAQRIGQVNNSNFSFKIGSVIAGELKSFGFNMDFAPVLDINSNPKNPVIGDRSFGTNAGIVSKLGIQTMKGIQSEGIIPVVKHFPGHGDTSVDSHVGLPVVNNDLKRLNGFELVPFAQSIKDGADAVMVAHILLSKIDSGNPASLSKTIITGILREDLGFDGVVITDDMTMGAIANGYDIGAAAVKSVNAGSDIILIGHFLEKETAVITALKNAAEAGAIPADRIDESVYRILKLKQKYNLSDKAIASVDIKSINTKINNVLNAYLSVNKKTTQSTVKH